MNAPSHVLVLDDDEGLLRLARKALERAGYRVTPAASAHDAGRIVLAENPDLLILDYNLNGPETGLDFFRALRATGSTVPAIMVTGFTDESRIIEALRAGIADVVPKAGDYLDYLPEAVARVLSQARMEQKLAEAELLREREQHYRTLAEALPQLVWTTLPSGACDFLSKQWVDYTGIPEADQLDFRWTDLVLHPDDRARTVDAWMNAVAGNASYDVEFRLRRHDGVYRWFKARGLPLRDRESRIIKWFGTCTDVHDQREALEERERLLAAEQKARKDAEEANQAKDRFLAMLSHELRTPLTPVLAAARMLQDSPDLPPSLAEDAQIIRRNIELEARLIDDLLDLTRVANGKLQLSLETVNVHAAIDAVLAIFRNDIQDKHLHIHVAHRATRHFVRADHARLQQMLWNLIKNAAKFTPENGNIYIESCDAADNCIAITVRDTGVGIDPVHLPRLFTAFEQGSPSVTRKFGGLGLGLAITKALVDLHRGRVFATSDGLGKGAIFTLELPAVASPAARIPASPAQPRPGLKSLRILLVEDHVDTAAVMARLITRLGHAVITVATVADALAAWKKSPFDFLMSDVGLPDGTGFDIIRAIRPASTTPAIALTGYGMEDDVRRCLAAGFNAHLTKPVNFPRLEQMITEIATTGTLKQTIP